MSGLIRGILSIFGGGPDAAPAQTPQINIPPLPEPAPVPPPPDRSDATIQNTADAQRRAFSSAGGRTINNLTGGFGVPKGSSYSAVTSLLGGVGRG